MDGENNGTPYEQMDDLGVPLFLETTILLVGPASVWAGSKSLTKKRRAAAFVTTGKRPCQVVTLQVAILRVSLRN